MARRGDPNLENAKLVILLMVFLAAIFALIFIIQPMRSGNLAGAGYGTGDLIPEEYGPPWDVFSNTPFFEVETLESVVSPDGNVTIDLNVSYDGMIIYQTYYVYENDSGDADWEPYNFPQSPLPGTEWIADFSEDTVEQEVAKLDSENWALVFTCLPSGDEWKCGCRDATDCDYWTIQRFLKPATCTNDPACEDRNDGDEFCSADQSQIYYCNAGSDGCLDLTTLDCTGGENCYVSGSTVECALCPMIPPDPGTVDCGTHDTGTLCNGTAYDVEGTRCSSGYCVGGACQECTDASQCDDNNYCTLDSCSSGSCVHTPANNDDSCTMAGGDPGYCSSGDCVECTLSSHCTTLPAGVDSECADPICSGTSCSFSPKNSGLDCTTDDGNPGTCQVGVCVPDGCTDTCASLGYQCGWQMVCDVSTYCGTCPGGQTCDTAGQCTTSCTHECNVGQTDCDGTVPWTCGEAGDGDDCRDKIYGADCAPNACVSGQCQSCDTCTGSGSRCGPGTVSCNWPAQASQCDYIETCTSGCWEESQICNLHYLCSGATCNPPNCDSYLNQYGYERCYGTPGDYQCAIRQSDGRHIVQECKVMFPENNCNFWKVIQTCQADQTCNPVTYQCENAGGGCGDGTCASGEECTCASDCGAHCGNGACDCGETSTTCASDCSGGGLPDLVVEAFAENQFGEDGITVRTCNQGGYITGVTAIDNEWSLGPPTGTDWCQLVTADDIIVEFFNEPGECYDDFYSHTFLDLIFNPCGVDTSPGNNVRFKVFTDSDFQVAESNEDNNDWEGVICIGGGCASVPDYDLTINCMFVPGVGFVSEMCNGGPGDLPSGQLVERTASLEHPTIGWVDVTGTEFSGIIPTGGCSMQLTEFSIADLNSWGFPTTSEIDAGCIIDQPNDFTETDENNNEWTGTICIDDCSGPDPDEEPTACVPPDWQWMNPWHGGTGTDPGPTTGTGCCGNDANEHYIEKEVEREPGVFTTDGGPDYICCNDATDCPMWSDGCANYQSVFGNGQIYCGPFGDASVCNHAMECEIREGKQCYWDAAAPGWRWKDIGAGGACENYDRDEAGCEAAGYYWFYPWTPPYGYREYCCGDDAAVEVPTYKQWVLESDWSDIQVDSPLAKTCCPEPDDCSFSGNLGCRREGGLMHNDRYLCVDKVWYQCGASKVGQAPPGISDRYCGDAGTGYKWQQGSAPLDLRFDYYDFYFGDMEVHFQPITHPSQVPNFDVELDVLFSSEGRNTIETKVRTIMPSEVGGEWLLGYGVVEWGMNCNEYVRVQARIDPDNDVGDPDPSNNDGPVRVIPGHCYYATYDYRVGHCGNEGEWPCDNSNPSDGKQCYDTTLSACGAFCDASAPNLQSDGGCWT